MTPPEKPDEELLRLIRSKRPADREAAAAYLTDFYRPVVRRLVWKRTGNGDLEQEVLDLAVVALMTMIERGEYQPAQGRIGAYFYGIAKRKLLTIVEKENQRRSGDDHYAQHRRQTGSDDPAPADRQLLRREQVEQMARALERLDPECRELLRRYWYKREALKDIAEEKQLKDATLRKRHERCLNKLKDILGKDPRTS